MLEIGSSSRSITDSSLGDEINVLLVEGDKGWLSSTTHLFQMYSYKVTNVETAVAALSVLSDGKKDFDIMLVDINIKDMDAFTLLKLSANMDLLTMLMSEKDDDATISKALKSGAFLLVRRPITIDVVKQMRQHVIRERMQRVNKYDDEINVFDVEINGASENRKELKRKVGITINEEGKKRKAKIGVAKKTKRGKKSNKNQESNSLSSVNNNVRNGSVKRKTSTEWTEELHEKFMDAVNQLGEGRCYPKEILETMNVPGLARMQVASHLQKCRNDNWQTPVKRKYYRHPSSVEGSKEGSQRSDNHRRFGSKPHINQIEPNVQENIYATDTTSLLGIVFTENGAKQNQQKRKVRNRFGSYPLMMKGKEPTTFYNGAQTMDNTDCETAANYIAKETLYAPTIEQTSENHNYDPINMNLAGTVIPGGEFPSITIEQTSENQTYDPINLDQKQPDDDFIDFLHGNMDDYVPDLSAVLQEGSTVNQGSASESFLYGYSLTDKATVSNPNIGGQWRASPYNYFGH